VGGAAAAVASSACRQLCIIRLAKKKTAFLSFIDRAAPLSSTAIFGRMCANHSYSEYKKCCKFKTVIEYDMLLSYYLLYNKEKQEVIKIC
jgi:hypothetical protein